jgi:hypothetical protein
VVVHPEEVTMVRATFLKEPRTWAERAPPVRQDSGACFMWSLAKIRIARLVLLGAASPAAAGLVVSVPFVKWFCLVWLVGVALLMRGLSRRASANTVVLSVDQRGILDRRLMSRHIEWQEIEAIFPVNEDRSDVVDIKLRWPKITLAETRWPIRIGAYCQIGYGVPAVTISMLLLEGNVSEMLDAVAQYRPDLLHHTNRRAPLTGYPTGEANAAIKLSNINTGSAVSDMPLNAARQGACLRLPRECGR